MDDQLPKQSLQNPDFAATNELFANEIHLKNYNTDIIKKITRGLKSHSFRNILEFGAGIGALAKEYFKQNKVKPDCIEIDPTQIKIIQNQQFQCFNNINHLSKKYEAIYSSNVLEHIEDDIQTLKDLKQHLLPQGKIAIYVPAFMCLWSQMDELVGHYRRYTKKELSQKVTAAGYHVLSCHYVDSVGFFAWLYLRIKGYKSGDITATTSNKSLTFYDRYLYPISRFMDFIGFKYVFGKNVLLIAQKY